MWTDRWGLVLEGLRPIRPHEVVTFVGPDGRELGADDAQRVIGDLIARAITVMGADLSTVASQHITATFNKLRGRAD
jgi:hypothetical protein